VIAVNGTPNPDVPPGASVRGLLDVLGVDAEARGVAVAVDAEVIPRPEWPTHVLGADARVEVLIAVQGG
jgi:sulfur carrier protein